MRIGSLLLTLVAAAGWGAIVTADPHPDGIVGPVPLTRDAKRSDFVVLAEAADVSAMTGFCDASSPDWRGWMPIYLARALGPERPIILTNLMPLKDRAGRCRLCYSGSKAEINDWFDCEEWMKTQEQDYAKFLIIVGTGSSIHGSSRLQPADYPNMLTTLTQPWVNPSKTNAWHFPITRRPEVDQNMVFHKAVKKFRVMRDGDWIKPVEREGLSEWIDWCLQQPKRNELLYVARYHGWKGQLDFMRHANPKLLKGYTIHFYTSTSVNRKDGATYPEQLEEIAKKRGIDVVVNFKSKSREFVANHSCHAKGLLHFARIDANPRVVTESIINGLQVFVSKQARVPSAIKAKRFVKVTSNKDDGVNENLNADLKEFMEMLDKPENHASLVTFAKEHLDPPRAYHKLCRQIGICAMPEEL